MPPARVIEPGTTDLQEVRVVCVFERALDGRGDHRLVNERIIGLASSLTGVAQVDPQHQSGLSSFPPAFLAHRLRSAERHTRPRAVGLPLARGRPPKS